MTNIFTSKTNFAAGELSTDLLGRVDINAYANGALSLKNVFVEPTGGVHRRPGLQFMANVSSSGRLIAFEQSQSKRYLILVQAGQTRIYQGDTLVDTLTTPWTQTQLSQIAWCQLNNGILIVHPDVAPRKIVLNNTTWSLQNFAFLEEDNCILQPYYRFAGDDVTIASSGCGGTVTLTTSADVFTNDHIGMQFKIADGYVLIQSVTNATQATGVVKKKLMDGENIGDSTALNATRHWGEPAFTTQRGWPSTVCTYQSRLVFGGSKSLPSTLWFSQTGDITNFEQGDGYDAEAIEFQILSNQSDHIAALFAGRHLQVFTASAEWMVSGDPLTPSNIQLKRQTQVGSRTDIFVPPIGIDGATIFAGADGHEIREFLFSDLEGVYQATDLSLLARHLIQKPIDMAYDKHERQAYIVMNNGHLVTLTSFRAEDLQSWTEQITDGAFLSVAILGETAYFLIKRGENYFLECFNNTLHTDAGITRELESATTTFTSLNHLNGKTVSIVGDGIVMEPMEVQNNQLVLPHAVEKIEIGLPFTHIIIPLPPVASANNGAAPVSSCRLVRAVFRLVDTFSLEIDTGTGVHQEIVPEMDTYCLDNSTTQQTKDLVLRSLGWVRSPTQPLWEIIGSSPQAFKLVSVTSDIKLGG